MRKDGKRVKDANPIYTVMPYILKYRYDAMNMIEVDIPISPMQTYLNEKRKQGYRFSHLGVVLAAYLRTAAEEKALSCPDSMEHPYFADVESWIDIPLVKELA